MHTRYDQAFKQLLRAALAPLGVFTPEVEVSPDPQRVDGWFVPDPARSSSAGASLLGRMSRSACTFEVFSDTPDDAEIVSCVRKQLNLRHVLLGRESPPPLPHLWVLSSGRPTKGLRALAARSKRAWPRGVYAFAPGLHTSVVVASELPEDRSTLLLRLMGRGRTLRRAVGELKTLGADDFERCIALPILIRYRIEAATAPVTPTDEELLMNTQEIMDMWERQAKEQGRQEGLQEGAQEGLLRGQRRTMLQLLRLRFGELPPAVVARIEAADSAALDQWTARVLAAKTPEEVVA